MSDSIPGGSDGGPEYLGSALPDDSSAPGGGRRRGVIGAAAGVAAVAVLGGWGAYALLAGGTQPAEVIPASAVGYLAVDLDPSATQKIEAVRMLKKFPGIADELDISGRDDLREWLFNQLQEDGVCEDLDYAQDIKPWIGNRAAVAVMPMTGDATEPPLLFALQVTDEKAAAEGIEALADCGESQDSNEFGYTFAEGYLLVSQDEAQAKSLATQAETTPLSDDPGFQSWTERAGDRGIVTMYAAAGAADAFVDGMAADEAAGLGNVDPQAEQRLRDSASAMFDGFDGMAATIRFDNGALEAEWAGKGIPSAIPPTSDGTAGAVLELPADTGAALSIALPEGWLKGYLERLSGMFKGMPGAPDLDELLELMEAESGLELPADIETLLGSNVTVAMDSSFDFETFMNTNDRANVPVGILVQGDTEGIVPVAEKVRDMLDPRGESIVIEPGDGEVAFGISPEYTRTLLGDGGLDGVVAFQDVVPEAESANSVLFVNFDAGGGWVEDLAKDEPEVAENIAPLDALGVSSWLDDDSVEHGLIRLTTD